MFAMADVALSCHGVQALQGALLGVQCCGEGGFGSTSHRRALQLLTAACKHEQVSRPASGHRVVEPWLWSCTRALSRC